MTIPTHIIEVDQWTSTGNIRDQDFDTVSLSSITGGDSEAAKAIFGGTFLRKTVFGDQSPPHATVWFRRAPDGKCEGWKHDYDTSG